MGIKRYVSFLCFCFWTSSCGNLRSFSFWTIGWTFGIICCWSCWNRWRCASSNEGCSCAMFAGCLLKGKKGIRSVKAKQKTKKMTLHVFKRRVRYDGVRSELVQWKRWFHCNLDFICLFWIFFKKNSEMFFTLTEKYSLYLFYILSSLKEIFSFRCFS